MKTIHINLLSAQLLPNVIPTLTFGEVEKVYLVLAGKTFANKAQRLRQFYMQKGIAEVEIYPCDDPNDYYALRHTANALYEQIRALYPEAYIALNATGGTKPMSFAFALAFDKLQQHSMSIYTDSINKQVQILTENDKVSGLPYAQKINLEDYFYLHDFALQGLEEQSYLKARAESRRRTSVGLLGLANLEPQMIAMLNSLAHQTQFNATDHFYPEVRLDQVAKGLQVEMFSLLEEADILSFTPTQLRFKNREAARYACGGWYEEVIYLAAKDAGIDTIGLNLIGRALRADGSLTEVENELDLVLLSHNQLLIIEAKTMYWQRGIGQQHATRLDSLSHHYGGQFAQGMLLSLFPPSEAIVERFAQMPQVSIENPESFQQLIQLLSRWQQRTAPKGE